MEADMSAHMIDLVIQGSRYPAMFTKHDSHVNYKFHCGFNTS
ncbi:hypothetical protein BOMU111920_01680 [Bordetella muralis]